MKHVLAHNLKRLLKENDLSVAQLSRSTKIPAQTLNNWLAGLEPRSISQVKVASQYFKMTLDELVYGEFKKTYDNKIEQYSDEINAGIFEVVLRRKK